MGQKRKTKNEQIIPRFTKEDCGKEMTNQEIQSEQLSMLDAVAKFCDENGIRYFLSGGTLLGAIRHKGFIPWDDDVDIAIPRPDCEKLFSISSGKIGGYILSGPDMDGTYAGRGFYRLYNDKAVVEDFSMGNDLNNCSYEPMFVDIFPVEGLPEGEIATELHYLRIVFLRRMQRSSYLKQNIAKSKIAWLFHIVTWIPAKIVGYKRWSIAIQNTAKKYDFNESKYVGVMTVSHRTTEEKLLKKKYLNVIDVPFEGRYYHAPGNFDAYLTQFYGDYLELPPVEKQTSGHQFRIYWRK